jgi:mannosyltransferase OCH1-like enzyme
MIEKTINYVWFGESQLPDVAVECISSWKNFCPEYKIVEWNKTNFDFTDCEYAIQAYESKMWAFVSDYARLKILHKYGGVYMDVDVELIKNIDPLLKNKAFMGFEDGLVVNTGLICGSEPGNPLFAELIEKYKTYEFLNLDGSFNLTPCVEYQTKLLEEFGLKKENKIQKIKDITIYPQDYFSPFNHRTGILNITDNTYSIHKYEGSWGSEVGKYGNKLTWKYRAKFGVFLGSIIRLVPYSFYIIKNYGYKAFLKKVRDKF